MKNELKGYRHGDVMLVPVTEKPQGDWVKKKELTVALGEATGHHHTFYPATKGGSVSVLEVNGRMFIDVGADYFLRHQEHHEHLIAPGCYERVMEDEYDPFEKIMKKVVD